MSSAGELSDIANVPRSRAYDILESLEKKGFILMKLGKPIKYIAIPPAEVVERVKKKIKQDLEHQEKHLDEIKQSKILDELTNLHNKGVDVVEPTEISGSIKTRDGIHNHIDFMINSAEKEIILVTSSEGLQRKHEQLKKSFKKAKENGVSIKIAAPLTKISKDALNELKEFAEVRHLNNIQARFCMVDKNQFLFMLMDDAEVHPEYDYGVWVNTRYFSQAISDMFQESWKNAKPVKS